MRLKRHGWSGWTHYDDTGKQSAGQAKLKIVSCKFCFQELNANAVRCRTHLLSCKRVSQDIKQQFEKEDPPEPEPGSSAGHVLSVQPEIPVIRKKRPVPSEQEHRWVAAMISGNIPFNVSDNVHLKQFFDEQAGIFVPPSRRTIVQRILPEMYEEAEEYQMKCLQKAKHITIIIDSSINVRSSGVINIIFATPFPILIDIIECKGERKTAQYYCDLVLNVIHKLEERSIKLLSVHGLPGDKDLHLRLKEIIVAITTDNENTMISFRSLMKQHLPVIGSVGCTAHLLNLIVKDFCKHEQVLPFLKKATEIFKDIKNSTRAKGDWDVQWKRYAEEQKEMGIIVRARGVNLPTDVRWYSYNHFVHRMLSSKSSSLLVAVQMQT